MYDKHFVGLDLTGFQDNGIQRPISRITLKVDDEHALTAGDDTGREITADCPHATQAMVNSLLAQLKGTTYQMFSADDANLNPAAELGDGITAGGVYSVISRIADDGSGYAGVSAPGEAELEDEYPAGGPMTQEFNRKIAQTRSSITKTAEQIRLEVANEVAGLNARITIEVDRITSEVNNTAAGLNSKIEQTASSLTSTITSTKEGLESKISQTASSLTTKINDTQNGLSSQIQQTASSLEAKISATDGRVTSLSASLDGVTVSVKDAEENISTLTQTASSLSASISDATGRITTVEATINGLTVKDAGGTTFISGSKIATKSITANQIDVDTLRVSKIYDSTGTKTAIDCSDTTSLQIGGVNAVSAYNKVLIRGTQIILGKWGDSTLGLEISQDRYNPCLRSQSSDIYKLGDDTHFWRGVYTNELVVAPINQHTTGGMEFDTFGIVPQMTGARYLGKSDKEWRNLYVQYASVSKGVGFFGKVPMSKQIVTTMLATTSTTAMDVATHLNKLISALNLYGLV